MKRLVNISALFMLLMVVAHAQTSAPAAWTPELQIKTRTVGTARVSPDGKHVVYTVSDAVMTAERSEFVTQLWLATTDGKETFQLTFNDKSSGNPKWSPDGNWIAFTSNRKENKSNIYLLSLRGGEAEPLTDVKTGVSNFEWSPDGKWIAFTMSDAKTEDEEKNDKAKNDFRWVDENLKMSRLYVIPVQKDGNGKRESRKLTTENYNVGDFDWSPDGTRIVFDHTRTPGANDWTTADVSIVEVATAKATVFANTAAAESSPLYSPDGKWIAMTVSDNPPTWAASGLIEIFPAAGGQAKAMAGSFDAQPGIIGWSGDGKRIYFNEAKGTATALYSLDVTGNKIAEITATPAVLGGIDLNRTGTMLGFVRQTPDTPTDAFVSAVSSFAPVQVSHANGDVKLPPIGKTEVIRWSSKDGKEIEGLLTYPVGYQAGQRVPLILNIHGGPTGVFQQTFLGGRGPYPLATFCAGLCDSAAEPPRFVWLWNRISPREY